MKNLVKTKKSNGTQTNSVDARELHKALEVKKAFTTWIKSSLDSAGAIVDEDYQVLKSSLEGSGYKKVFILTVDMAKHIAMMSKVPKAKEVRDYFIRIEEEATKAQPLIAMDDVIKSLQLTAQGLKHQDERLDDQHKRINAQHNIIVSQDDRLIQLENNVRLTNQQEYELTQVHHKKVYELARLYGEDQNDKKLISKLHRQVWKLFKNHFMLPRFNELQANKFNDGIAFLNGIKLKDI